MSFVSLKSIQGQIIPLPSRWPIQQSCVCCKTTSQSSDPRLGPSGPTFPWQPIQGRDSEWLWIHRETLTCRSCTASFTATRGDPPPPLAIFSFSAPNVTFHFCTEPAGVEMKPLCRIQSHCNWFIYSELGLAVRAKVPAFYWGQSECQITGESGMWCLEMNEILFRAFVGFWDSF